MLFDGVSLMNNRKMIDHKTAVTNRTRYALLNDRRRALFELHKLTEVIRAHRLYPAATEVYPGLSGIVDDSLASTSGDLCGRACQASLGVLERDLRRLYQSLAELAKVWVGLEDEQNLEPLVAAYYEVL